MPSKRFINRRTFTNTSELYKEKLRERGLKQVEQWNTASFPPATPRSLNSITSVPHQWRVGDRFWNISYKYYGVSSYWYVIAWFNHISSEADLAYGKTIYIPFPVDDVIEIMQERKDYTSPFNEDR
jgi:hypothetical protein